MTTPSGSSRLAQVNGIELGYEVFGEGRPLVLLHGGFGTMEMFGPNVELLAAGRQVVGASRSTTTGRRRSPGLSVPTMLVVGDADGMPPSHAVELFELLCGGRRDAGFDRSGMTPHRLAVLPGVTHYDINDTPALAAAVIPFLDGADAR